MSMRSNGTRSCRRVLMTADAVGGVWTYALELARALGKYDVEVCIALMGPQLSQSQQEEASAINNLTLFQSQFKLEWMEDCWSDVEAAGHWLLDLESRIEPDIVHLNSYAHGSLPWSSPTIVVAHSCVFSWWAAVRGGNPTRDWRRYHDEVSLGLAGANIVVAPSRAMLNALEQHYDFKTPAIVIHNGRNPDLFSTGQKRKFIMSAGRLWDEAKNVSTLAAVAEHLQWPVCVAGEIEHPNRDLSNYIGNHCRFLGKLSNRALSRWLSAAAIFALPVRYEPFGLTAVEAGASGCALVVGDIESQREIWQDAALFVDPNSPQHLEATLQMLIHQFDFRMRMASRARERAIQFSSQRMVQSYYQLYNTMVHDGSREAFAECA